VLRTHRYRLYPTLAQVDALNGQLASCCDLYNAALEHRRRMWREHGVSVSYADQSAELRALRAARLIPPDANFWCQQAVLRRLDRAFGAFFRRLASGEKPGHPRFKSRRRFDTLVWTLKGNAGGVAIKHGKLALQGVGGVKVKWHRELPEGAVLGEVKVARASDGRRWHVSISVEIPEPEQRPRHPRPDAMVGIDVGVRDFAALATGERVIGPGAQKTNKASVRRAARKVARRRRGSSRRRNAVLLLARQREREANRRRDHAHKLSRRISDSYAVIAMEDLQIRNMVRSASGTVQQPGVNVAQKAGLNRAISDQGWGQFQKFTTYKAEEAGGCVIKVTPANTSRTCATCGTVDARNRHAKRFRCTSCGHRADADVNAAQVILARALVQAGINRPGWGRQTKTAALAAVV
jgi:putative transposase